MTEVKVSTPNKTYDILFRTGFGDLPKAIGDLNKSYSKLLIISDSNVAPLYADTVKEALSPLGKEVAVATFTAGEASKNYETINGFYQFLIEHQYDRKTLILALGGGITGDMAGFTAATYMRGVDFVQVPTSLLAQVDSSVGGKTGIDFNGYKNIVGAFYQPEFVYINTETLKTLPEVEFACGMGEALKHGMIRDKEYLDYMADNRNAIQSLDHEAIAKVVGRSCEIKANVVSQDEKEHGLRATLNFGHTIGHAVERLMNFELLHGQSIALGMVASVKMAVDKGDLNDEDLSFTENLFTDFKLPIRLGQLTSDKVYEQLFYDKKTKDSIINIVMLDAMGSCYQNRSLTEAEIKVGLNYILGETK